MSGRNTRDMLGGALLVIFGLMFALFAISNYPVGTLARMQPGMFPAIIGFLLAAIGAILLVPAVFAKGDGSEKGTTDYGTLLCVLAGILGFGVVIMAFGMVPAVYVLVLISTLPDRRLSVGGKLALASAIAALVVVIFRFGLGLNVALLKWPF